MRPTAPWAIALLAAHMSDPAITVRAASPRDWRTLEWFAWLGRRTEPPADKALLAERDVVLVAAIALTSGSVLTDPFHPTGDAARLLKLTRYLILRHGGQAGAGRVLTASSGNRSAGSDLFAMRDRRRPDAQTPVNTNSAERGPSSARFRCTQHPYAESAHSR